MTGSRWTIGGALLAVTLGLAGCAAGGSAGTSDAAAPAATSEQPSPTPSVAVGDTVSLGALAARELAAMKKAGPAQVAEQAPHQDEMGTVDLSTDPPSVDLAGTVNGHRVRIVVADGVLYFGGALAPVDGRSKLLKIIPGQNTPDGKAASMMLAFFAQALSGPPQSSLTAATTANVIAVSGHEVTYQFLLSSAAMEEQLRQYGLSTEQAKAAAESALTTLVLDENDLPVSQSTTISSGTTTISYSGWGSTKPVAVPPPSLVQVDSSGTGSG